MRPRIGPLALALALAGAGAALAVLPLAGCDRHPADRVWADRAWVRLAAVPGRPAAAYVTLHGADAPARLVAVDSPAAGSGELHEMLNREGPEGGAPVMAMDRVDGIDLPAGQTVALSPGGYHAMLFGVAPAVKPGSTMPLTVRLAKGDPVTVDAKVVAAGDDPAY